MTNSPPLTPKPKPASSTNPKPLPARSFYIPGLRWHFSALASLGVFAFPWVANPLKGRLRQGLWYRCLVDREISKLKPSVLGKQALVSQNEAGQRGRTED